MKNKISAILPSSKILLNIVNSLFNFNLFYKQGPKLLCKIFVINLAISKDFVKFSGLMGKFCIMMDRRSILAKASICCIPFNFPVYF